jgi:hypothetical protein
MEPTFGIAVRRYQQTVLALFLCGCSQNGTAQDTRVSDRELTTDGTHAEARQPDVVLPKERTVKETELSWDDGTCEMTNGPGGDSGPGGMIAACFTPRVYPVLVSRAGFFVAGIGKPTTTFGVRLFNGDGKDGRPGSEIPIPKTTGAATSPQAWVYVDLSAASVSIASGAFCVAMEWLTPFGSNLQSPDAQVLCSDNDKPDGRSWIRWAKDGSWWGFEEIGVKIPTDVMIRAVVSE